MRFVILEAKHNDSLFPMLTTCNVSGNGSRREGHKLLRRRGPSWSTGAESCHTPNLTLELRSFFNTTLLRSWAVMIGVVHYFGIFLVRGSPPNIVTSVLALSKSHQFSISLNFSEMILIDVDIIISNHQFSFFSIHGCKSIRTNLYQSALPVYHI